MNWEKEIEMPVKSSYFSNDMKIDIPARNMAIREIQNLLVMNLNGDELKEFAEDILTCLDSVRKLNGLMLVDKEIRG